MIRLTRQAARQLSDLRRHYEALDRIEAVRNLAAVIRQAAEQIEQSPESGFPAPRPYPHLARSGRAWVKIGRYWVAYSVASPPVITGIFYDTANIPDRTN